MSDDVKNLKAEVKGLKKEIQSLKSIVVVMDRRYKELLMELDSMWGDCESDGALPPEPDFRMMMYN